MGAPSELADLQELIRHRAEEIYFRTGSVPGRDVQNWTQAEQEILQECQQLRRTAVVVEVDGVQYVGEYTAESAKGYRAGEIVPGDPVELRFEGDKMFLRRLNDEELETTIVHRVG